MKKIIILGLLISSTMMQMQAMGENKSDTLTFIAAQKNEDLSPYKEILLKVYLQFITNPENKKPIEESLASRFDILASWIGQPGKLFIKAHKDTKPVGFLTLESLDEANTRVAFHQSPLLLEHLDKYPQYFAFVKRLFPTAQAVFTAASDKVVPMQVLIKKMGFVEDPSYVPNKELIPNPAGFMGYKKILN